MLEVTELNQHMKISYPGLGAKIKSNRKRLKLTQMELAEILDISWMTIHRWEHDERSPKFLLVGRMAQLFQVSLEYMVSYDTNKVEE